MHPAVITYMYYDRYWHILVPRPHPLMVCTINYFFFLNNMFMFCARNKRTLCECTVHVKRTQVLKPFIFSIKLLIQRCLKRSTTNILLYKTIYIITLQYNIISKLSNLVFILFLLTIRKYREIVLCNILYEKTYFYL
jgi:hypothetical protein